MARFLVAGWPFAGELNPRVAIAQALRVRGHEVAFYTGARAGEMLQGLGYTFYPVRGVDDETIYRQHSLYQNDGRVGRALTLSDWRRLKAALHAFLIDTIPGQMADLEPILDQWRPDAIIGDHAMLAPFLILHETRSIPVAMVQMSLGSMVSGPEAPPWGRGLPPPNTPTRRLRVGLDKAAVRLATRDLRAAASAMRARYGLPPLSMPIADYAGAMELYLVSSLPELDYNRRDHPPSVRFVGRLTWERPSDLPPPAWIDELPDDKPLVYVTEGTIHGAQPKLLQAAARGLPGLPLQALLTITPDRDLAAAGLTNLASNVRLETQTPGRGWQGDILPRASLVVTNGGIGSVMSAIAAGVPMVVVPTTWDKPENAQRIVEAGIGVRLAPERCTPQRLREAVRHVLGDPSYRANARRLADVCARYGGPERAADLLEEMYAARQTRAAREPAKV